MSLDNLICTVVELKFLIINVVKNFFKKKLTKLKCGNIYDPRFAIIISTLIFITIIYYLSAATESDENACN